MAKIKGYAAADAKAPLAPFTFERRVLRPKDVKIKILYCGICHSDLHTARNEWKGTTYPCVPGHEIVGSIVEVGEQVTRFKVGERAAVGCMVDSCRTCANCKNHLQQYCEQHATYTYNSKDKIDGSNTYGGYSAEIVVDEDFVLNVPKEFEDKDLAAVAPLLCAGITTYSPLRHWKIDKGSKVGIVGIGGLGHVAIKIAHAMGAHVVVFTSNLSKGEEAKRLGADEVYSSKDPKSFEKLGACLDFILDTVSVSHDLDPFIQLLKTEGIFCLLGAPPMPHPSPNIQNLIFNRRCIAGSLIGGIQETQEMLDFCAKHHITADIEMIPITDVNKAYERMLASDVKYRFVIDMTTL